MESDQTLQGGQLAGQPVASSGGPGVQQPSLDTDSVVNALLNNPALQEALERKVQSVKDRRFAEQEREISGFRQQLAQLERLQGAGMSRDLALTFMENDARLKDLEQRVTPSTQGVSGVPTPQPGGAKSVDADTFLKAVGVDPSDPEVTELYRAGNVTPETLLQFVVKKKASPTASPAQVMPTGAGSSVKEDLMARYKQEVMALPPGQLRIDLRNRYRQQGLDI